MIGYTLAPYPLLSVIVILGILQKPRPLSVKITLTTLPSTTVRVADPFSLSVSLSVIVIVGLLYPLPVFCTKKPVRIIS